MGEGEGGDLGRSTEWSEIVVANEWVSARRLEDDGA